VTRAIKMQILTTSRVKFTACLTIAVSLGAVLYASQRAKKNVGIVGSLLNLGPGTFLSRAPDAAADQATTGSPVLVLQEAETKGWIRVLAADGASGWTRALSPRAVPVRVVVSGSVSDRPPDDPSAAEPKGLKGDLRITGASQKSAVASLAQMMLPATSNWYLAPWLKVSSAAGMGWIAPSEAGFTWAKIVQARGMVRPPFTMQYSGLTSLEPHEGDGVLRVNETGDSAELSKVSPGENWPRLHAIFFADAAPQAILFANDSARVLRLAVSQHGGFLVFQKYLPELDKVTCSEAGSAKRICLAQVTALHGDGYVSSVWGMDVSADGATRVKNIELPAASGEANEEPAANWWWDGNAGILGVLSANEQNTSAVLYHYSTETGFTVAGRSAAGAFLPARATYREARAESITVTKNELDVFPIAEAHAIRWAPGRVFAQRAEAESWKNGQKFEVEIRLFGFGGSEGLRP